MSVAVANTTANVSGQTVELAERDQTITGLKTFDRDPSAPFAVSASSAVVTNLDADKVDGLEASAFLLIAGGTMTGDLKFTDATYDIGKSGATRPRDGFFSRNMVVGGTLGVTGVATFTADVLTTAWTDYTGSSTIVGWAATPSPQLILYKKVGKLVFVSYYIEGTSDSATTTFTVPVAAATTAGNIFHGVMPYMMNNGTEGAIGRSQLPSASSTVTLIRSASDPWTSSGLKRVGGQFWYEAAS